MKIFLKTIFFLTFFEFQLFQILRCSEDQLTSICKDTQSDMTSTLMTLAQNNDTQSIKLLLEENTHFSFDKKSLLEKLKQEESVKAVKVRSADKMVALKGCGGLLMFFITFLRIGYHADVKKQAEGSLGSRIDLFLDMPTILLIGHFMNTAFEDVKVRRQYETFKETKKTIEELLADKSKF